MNSRLSEYRRPRPPADLAARTPHDPLTGDLELDAAVNGLTTWMGRQPYVVLGAGLLVGITLGYLVKRR